MNSVELGPDEWRSPDVRRPSGWRAFWEHTCEDQRTVKLASLFGSRYSLFSELKSSAFDSAPDKADSYYILLKIALAYSAYEAFTNLSGSRKFEIRDLVLAHQIRVNGSAKFSHSLSSAIENKKLKARLDSFFLDEADSDLTPVITAIRHGFFHPAMSASGLGLVQSKRFRAVLLMLVVALDNHIQLHFAEWSEQHFDSCNVLKD